MKKAIFPAKRFWPFFSHYRVWKTSKTIYKGPKGILTITVEVIRSFLWDLRECWKQKSFEEKWIFPLNKWLWPSFSRIIECDKHQWTFYNGPQGVLTKTVEVIRSFLQDIKGCWNQMFLRSKGYRSEEKFLAHSFSYYPLWQTSSNLLLGSTRYFGIYGPCYKIISVKRLSTKKVPFEYVGLNRKTVWRDFRQKTEQKQ